MASGEPIRALSGCARAALCLGMLASAGPVTAGPITFNTALPVARDTYTARIQGIHRDRADAGADGREVTIDGGVAALGYGFTADWTGIALAPYLDKTLTVDTSGGTVRRQASGLGDLTLLARYTAFERNAPGALLRIAPVAGGIAPTGASDERDALGTVPRPLQPGTGVWGGVAGVILTRQTLDWEFDAALMATFHGRDDGFEPGDEVELDASYQYRMPWPAPGAGAFSYAVLEAKGIHREDDMIEGSRVENGGTEWRIVPGLQYVTRRWVVEAAVELPLADDLPGSALREQRFVHLGVRFNF